MPYWYPEEHDASAARFWACRPACDAYMLVGDQIVPTTVYESPTRPYWYSLDLARAGLFGLTLFASELQATEHLMATLMEQQRHTNLVLDQLADRYNELLLAEEEQAKETEYELSAEHAHVGTQ